jgi:hypothetical protein
VSGRRGRATRRPRPRPSPSLAALAALLAALAALLLAACQGPGSGGGPTGAATPRPSATPTLTQQQQQAWRTCGAATLPPPSVFGPPASVPPVQNLTNGAVSTADGQAWAAAFVREQRIETWAQTALQANLLQGGCLGDPQAGGQLFGAEVTAVQKARQAGGRLTVQAPRLLDFRLIRVPDDVQQRIAGLLEAKSDYALVVHGQGPSATRVVHPDGRQEPVGDDIPANQVYYALFGGEYRKPGDGVGPIWYQKSAFNCQRDFLRAACGV